MVELLLEWVFTSVFLILVVLALRAALGKRMSAGLRYALWGVVLARLLVPVQLFTSPLAGTWVFTESRVEQNIYKVTDDGLEKGGPEDIQAIGKPDGPTVVLQTGPVLSAPGAPKVPDAPEPPAAPDLTKAPAWLGWTWIAGGAVVAFALLLSNLRFFWRLRRERIQLEDAGCPLRVYVAVGLPSPCLFGVLRPAVYVTPEAAANPDMLRHVLAHELTHFRHGDHIWSLLRCAALAVHWWNPLVWRCAVLSRRDGELACDEGALKRLGEVERAAYGNTLLALVTAKPRPGDLFRLATTMAGEKESLKERIGRIAQAPKRALWVTAAAVLAVSLACVCAFGQAAEEPGDEPGPSPDPTPSVSQPVEVEDGTVPAEVRADAEEFVREWFESFRDDGVIRTADGTASVAPDPPEVDGWRIDDLWGPFWSGEMCREVLGIQRPIELWRVIYSYHTTTPEKAESLVDGNIELTKDGWLGPINCAADYLVYGFDEDGNRILITYFDEAYENVWSVKFRSDLRIRLAAGGVPEDEIDSFYQEERAEYLPLEQLPGHQYRAQTDLNHNGVPEIMQLVTFDGGGVQRLELWETGAAGTERLIWYEEGFSAHAGWTSVFLCDLSDLNKGEYLLRYWPTMYGGSCAYSYELFTLEGGRETVARENSVEFDINFQPWIHEKFEPEAIAAFMDEINGLLAHSIQLINTDQNLLATFEREGRLYDSLWWLGMWEDSGFVYDESKSLADNLRDYQEAVERTWYAEEPELRSVDDNVPRKHMRLCYRDKVAYFDGLWDEDFQPDPTLHVLDLNGDGKDEIVFSLVWGHGTGCLVENLYAFDAETLEQYDTDGLTQMVLDSIESTGDGENFYLSGPGMGRVTIPRSEAREPNEAAPVADALRLGDIVYYSIGDDGRVCCRLGCDASGLTINYIGYVEAELELTGSGFRCVRCQYRPGDVYEE